MLYKSDRGITLTALVITIIVLLIFAGITVNTLKGDNGLINRAGESKKDAEKSSIEESIELAYMQSKTIGTNEINYAILNKRLKEIGYDGEDVTSLPEIININGKYIEILEDGEAKVLLLPNGYIKLAYIESTGTQYIDTGVNATKNTKVEVDAALLETSSVETDGFAQLFGIANTEAGLTINASVRSTAGACRFGSMLTDAGTLLITYNEKHTYEQSNNGLYIDGIKKYNWDTQSDFTSSNTMFLGRANGSGSTPSWKIYSCKIFYNDTLVVNLIPCKNSSKIVGMYDIVTGIFYENANSSGDDFTPGPEV